MRHPLSLALPVALLALASTPLGAQTAVQKPRIVGYYTSWSIYARNFHVPSIPGDKITHINFAFAKIVGGKLAVGDTWADTQKFYPGDSWTSGTLRGSFRRLQVLKQKYKHLQTLISVGGWTWSGNFSDAVLTSGSRQVFAKSCVAFILKYGFDGVDLDWEYPGGGGLGGNTVRAQDPANFTLFVQELRKQLDVQGKKDSRRYLLTIATGADPRKAAKLDLKKLTGLLDWINVMNYDYHGPWGGTGDPATNFATPLHPVKGDPTPLPNRLDWNCEKSLDYYFSQGVPASKIQMGLAFYGRGFGQVQSQGNGLFAKYSGRPSVGTWEKGVFDYQDIMANYIGKKGYVRYWNDDARAPWIYSKTQRVMISYEDKRSIREKAFYVRARGLGGAMFWEFSNDKKSELLTVINEVLHTRPALSQSSTGIVLAKPQRVALDVDGGRARRGRLYLILTGLTGSFPGLPLPGDNLPLNFDAFSAQALGLANSSVLPGFIGVLDAKGQAKAVVDFSSLGSLPLSLKGQHLSLAAWMIDGSGSLRGRSSNAVDLFFR